MELNFALHKFNGKSRKFKKSCHRKKQNFMLYSLLLKSFEKTLEEQFVKKEARKTKEDLMPTHLLNIVLSNNCRFAEHLTQKTCFRSTTLVNISISMLTGASGGFIVTRLTK